MTVTNFTSQWDDDNRDHFERNILSCRACGCCASCTSSTVTDEFDTPFDIEDMLCSGWPTHEDFVKWALGTGHNVARGEDPSKPGPSNLALMAAKQYIASSLGLSLAETTQVSRAVTLHTLIQASFLYFSKDAPHGALGTDEVNGVIQAGATHPIVERFLLDEAPIGLG